jgi:plastocyanin
MRPLLFTVALLGGFATAATPSLAADLPVNVFGIQFAPQSITIDQGDSVTWTNAGGFHNVRFDDGVVNGPASTANWTFTRTFDTAGTFNYFCDIHKAIGMTGSVVVKAASTTPSSGNTTPGSLPSAGTSPTAFGKAPASTPRAKCASRRRFRIRLREPGGIPLRSARVTVHGKPLTVAARRAGGRRRLTAMVDLRGLPRGAYEVSIEAVNVEGKRLEGTRSYSTCAAKRTPGGLPRL